MYTPHTVTLYNVDENALTGEPVYNITILEGVFLDVAKSDNVEKSGLADADTATLYIPFSVKAMSTGETPAEKTFIPPKRYRALDADVKPGYWTLETGGVNSGADCFFVKGNNVSEGGYATIREQFDAVFRVSTVNLRDFGTEDMRHWQVGGR